MTKDDFALIVYRSIRDSINQNIEWVEFSDNKITVLTKFGEEFEEKGSWAIDFSMIQENLPDSTSKPAPSQKKKESFLSKLFKARKKNESAI
tara:strand:+ start:39406 stop:39681 length:276 start_codon:yes stop_codon:yes gene_type:complete